MDVNEQQRLAAVHALHILDTEAEQVFDEAVLLASTICGTPVSLISILDGHRQWFKARVGLGIEETPREHAFCAHAIQQEGLFVVNDAQLDPRFDSNPLVTGGPRIRFYAGVPLVTAEACPLGTLCVIDTCPRELTKEQEAALTILGRQVTTQLELRMKVKALDRVLLEKNSVEDRINSSNALFHAFMDNCPLVGYVKDEDGRLLYYNQPFSEQFHITRTEWLDKNDLDIWPPEFAAYYRADNLAVLAAGKLVMTEETSPGPNGKVVHWRSYKFPFVNDEGMRFLAGMSLDVSTEKEAQEELKRSHDELHLANEQLRELSVTDALTGLSNRRGFDDRLRREFAHAARYGFDFSILMFDVDKFKSLNDTFGHEAGDEVLRQIGQLLREGCRRSDSVYRYGGEEFVILLPNTNLEHAVTLGDRIRLKIEAAAWKFRPITISVGVSTNVAGLHDAMEMIRMADLALYEAKEQGRNRVATYHVLLERACHAGTCSNYPHPEREGPR